MVNYENGKIYKIVDNTNGDTYIGSTTQKYLVQRLSSHVYDAKTNENVTSKQIILNGDYNIILIENYPCKSKDELHARERHFIETMECVNKVIPTRTIAEWREENKEQLKQNKVEYYQNNKETINKINAEYYEKNKEHFKQYKAEYYKDNKEIILKYREKNKEIIKQKKAEYCEKNKEKIKQYRAEYYQKNKNKVKENNI
jgi:hypothetical protein